MLCQVLLHSYDVWVRRRNAIVNAFAVIVGLDVSVVTGIVIVWVIVVGVYGK